jgi:predicted HTH transcriptional regulator
MLQKDLLQLLTKKESTSLEFKRMIDNPYKIARTLAAFANTSGGFLLLGINDDKSIQGVLSEQSEIEKLLKATDDLIDPPLSVSYQSFAINDKKVLVVEITESHQKPHQTRQPDGNSDVYIRANDQTIPAGKQMIQWLQVADINSSTLPTTDKNNKPLLLYLQKQDKITSQQFAKLVNISEKRAEKHLITLCKQGYLLYLDKLYPRYFCLKVPTN